MNRLACCPECGGMTHPLAEHLVKSGEISSTAAAAQAAPAAISQTAPPEPVSEIHCDNCGTAIGKLQKPFIWKGHPVCAACHRLLSEEKARARDESAPAPVVSPPAEAPAPMATPVVATVKSATVVESVEARPSEEASFPARQSSAASTYNSPVFTPPDRRGTGPDGPRLMDRLGEFAWQMRGKIVGFFAIALALYLIISIIQSIGVVLLWAGGLVAVAAIVWQIRRGWLALRRRVGSGRGSDAIKRITSIVRR
jgi:hypothetical protein